MTKSKCAERKNRKKARKLKDELERVLAEYHKNGMTSIAAIKHILEIANNFKNDDKRTKELGLSEDELAFMICFPQMRNSSTNPVPFRTWYTK